MRRLTLLVLLLGLSSCSTLFALSTDDYPDVEVVETHGLSQSEAYAVLLRWVAETYESAADVVQLADQDSGTLVLKAVQPMLRLRADYTMTMDVREGRVRFRQKVTRFDNVFTTAKKSHAADMEELFAELRASATAALRAGDDF